MPRRVGLKAYRINDAIPLGIFAMPVVPNFYTTHQWVRELKRGGQRRMCGVYFRVPDTDEVWAGHYNQPHARMTAAQAVGVVLRLDDAQGYEIIIPHSIAADAIVKVRDMPHLGWRYFPAAHGRRPCGCPACQGRGEIKSRRIRQAYEAQSE